MVNDAVAHFYGVSRAFCKAARELEHALSRSGAHQDADNVRSSGPRGVERIAGEVAGNVAGLSDVRAAAETARVASAALRLLPDTLPPAELTAEHAACSWRTMRPEQAANGED